jgi:hypothetical protein
MSQRRKPTPSLHALMIYAASGCTLAGLLAYVLAPAGRETGGITLMMAAIGFLFGKFTNGFKSNEKGVPGDDN